MTIRKSTSNRMRLKMMRTGVNTEVTTSPSDALDLESDKTPSEGTSSLDNWKGRFHEREV